MKRKCGAQCPQWVESGRFASALQLKLLLYRNELLLHEETAVQQFSKWHGWVDPHPDGGEV